MSPSLKYAATGVVAIALIVGTLWAFLDPASRRGVLLAAAVAIPVQVGAFWVIRRFRDDANAFMAAWIGGTFFRVLVVAVAAFAVIRAQMDGAVAMLLALVGFLFALLLLEPFFFRDGSGTLTNVETVEA